MARGEMDKLDAAMCVLTSLLADLEEELRNQNAHIVELDKGRSHGDIINHIVSLTKQKQSICDVTFGEGVSSRCAAGERDATLLEPRKSDQAPASCLDAALNTLTLQLADLEEELRDHSAQTIVEGVTAEAQPSSSVQPVPWLPMPMETERSPRSSRHFSGPHGEATMLPCVLYPGRFASTQSVASADTAPLVEDREEVAPGSAALSPSVPPRGTTQGAASAASAMQPVGPSGLDALAKVLSASSGYGRSGGRGGASREDKGQVSHAAITRPAPVDGMSLQLPQGPSMVFGGASPFYNPMSSSVCRPLGSEGAKPVSSSVSLPLQQRGSGCGICGGSDWYLERAHAASSSSCLQPPQQVFPPGCSGYGGTASDVPQSRGGPAITFPMAMTPLPQPLPMILTRNPADASPHRSGTYQRAECSSAARSQTPIAQYPMLRSSSSLALCQGGGFPHPRAPTPLGAETQRRGSTSGSLARPARSLTPLGHRVQSTQRSVEAPRPQPMALMQQHRQQLQQPQPHQRTQQQQQQQQPQQPHQQQPIMASWPLMAGSAISKPQLQTVPLPQPMLHGVPPRMGTSFGAPFGLAVSACSSSRPNLLLPSPALPASQYRGDPADPLDMMLSWCLFSLPRDVLSRLMLRRRRPGQYEIDGRKVTLLWSGKLDISNVHVREEEVVDPTEMPLSAYLSQAAHVADALSGPNGLGRIPPEKRLTFHQLEAESTSDISNPKRELERVGSMRLACEQARLREEFAAAYELRSMSGPSLVARAGHLRPQSWSLTGR